MRSGLFLALALALAACKREPEPGPLGIPLLEDGLVYAGIARLDLTPEVVETHTDLNGDHSYQGCLDDPDGSRCGGEPFDDVNGNGRFDPVWIGGFGPLRPATGVHDPITVSALVLSANGQYMAFVAMDLVGAHSPRIHAARDRLVAEGFDEARLLVSSSHNHQGPDVFGIWGNPFDFGNPTSGLDPAFQERLTDTIEASVRQAAAAMEPVDLHIGSVALRELSPYYSGEPFGGKNPKPRMHGMVHDIRDPVVVADKLTVLQGRGAAGNVFTLTNWSGHPETWGGDNTLISSDYVGVLRERLDASQGGTTIHLISSLGGMQSALGGLLPRIDAEGAPVWHACTEDAIAAEDPQCVGKSPGEARTYADGLPVPEWVEDGSWEFVETHGRLLAQAAEGALGSAEPLGPVSLDVEVETVWFPLENSLYRLFLPMGITELSPSQASFDINACPDVALGGEVGCLPVRTFQGRIGPLGFVAVPGELLPELAQGLPTDDPLWQTESADPSARGPGSRYFPQHQAACDTTDWATCQTRTSLDGCDCLSLHASPYTLSHDPEMLTLFELLGTEHTMVIGMNDHYLSYIVPEPDFHRTVSYLGDVGDHYEDSVSPTSRLAPILQDAQVRMAERRGW